MITGHAVVYLEELIQIANQLDRQAIEKMAENLGRLRKRKGRLFIIGMGGSAANASHMANDIRKFTGIEAYAPSDNISEMLASANDFGLSTIFSRWLEASNINGDDALFVLSVGGGEPTRNISLSIVEAVDAAMKVGAKVLGIVGREGGYVQTNSADVIVVPNVCEARITPHSETFQAVIWHCLVSHPLLNDNAAQYLQ